MADYAPCRYNLVSNATNQTAYSEDPKNL